MHEREKAITQAIGGLPDKRKSEGRALAVRAVEALGPTANYFHMSRAAENAVEDLARRSEHEAEVDRAMLTVSFYCDLNGVEETDTVRAAVRSALDSAPLGSNCWDLSERRTEAIKRFKSSATPQAPTTHDLQQVIKSAVGSAVAKHQAYLALDHFANYLREEYEASPPNEASMRAQLKAELEQRFAVGEFQSVAAAKPFIEAWVDENIELDDDEDDDSDEDDEVDDDWDEEDEEDDDWDEEDDPDDEDDY